MSSLILLQFQQFFQYFVGLCGFSGNVWVWPTFAVPHPRTLSDAPNMFLSLKYNNYYHWQVFVNDVYTQVQNQSKTDMFVWHKNDNPGFSLL